MAERLTIGFGDTGAAVHGIAFADGGALMVARGAVESIPEPQLIETAMEGGCRLRGVACEIALEPLGPPASLGATARVWICRATGTAGGRALDGLGSITRSSATAPAVLERAVTIWFGPDLSFALAARRGPRAKGHGDEDLAAAILRGEPLAPSAIAGPRLSTTYDAEQRPVRCGIELWETDDAEFAERIAGEATAHGALTHPDGSRTLVAFLACQADRRRGFGHYALRRRDDGGALGS